MATMAELVLYVESVDVGVNDGEPTSVHQVWSPANSDGGDGPAPPLLLRLLGGTRSCYWPGALLSQR